MAGEVPETSDCSNRRWRAPATPHCTKQADIAAQTATLLCGLAENQQFIMIEIASGPGVDAVATMLRKRIGPAQTHE